MSRLINLVIIISFLNNKNYLFKIKIVEEHVAGLIYPLQGALKYISPFTQF